MRAGEQSERRLTGRHGAEWSAEHETFDRVLATSAPAMNEVN